MIQERDIDSIFPYAKNPRKNSKAVPAVMESIKRYGFQGAIVADRDSIIVTGHTRWKAAKKLGMKTVPVRDAKKNGKWLTPSECNAYRIADNRTGEEASWDDDLLKAELEDLKIEMPDFDLSELTGFTDGEISKMIDTSVEGEDEVPEPRKTDIRLGDIYRLGEHRLMCADCTDENAVQLLMDGAKADMVFTDPPYGVSYSDKNKYLNKFDKGNKNQTEIENDMGLEEAKDIWLRAFKNIFNELAEYSSYYVCSPQGGEHKMMMMMMSEAGLSPRHEIIWLKNNHVLGLTDYNYKHEPILYGWAKKHKFYGYGEQNKSVWEFDKPHQSKLHPTMKPVELVENAVLNSTEKGMSVLDVFLGSGTTLIACEKTGRKCFGMEIDPSYCQVIIDRWQAFTGKQAVKVS